MSRASMEEKEERAGAREAHESYTILMEPDVMRNYRTLRREICVSRIVLSILLITCTAFFGLLCAQYTHGSKNNENTDKGKSTETLTELQTSPREANNGDAPTPQMASLSIKRRPTSAKANLTWWRYHRLMEDFCSGESCESLIIPQDGKYRLSLQIIYSGGIPKNPPDLQIKLAHKIVMYHDMERPVTLRTVYETETVHENSPWFKSVSSEVIYVFRKGDKIMVESENADLIYTPDVDWWTINLLTIQLISEIN